MVQKRAYLANIPNFLLGGLRVIDGRNPSENCCAVFANHAHQNSRIRIIEAGIPGVLSFNPQGVHCLWRGRYTIAHLWIKTYRKLVVS